MHCGNVDGSRRILSQKHRIAHQINVMTDIKRDTHSEEEKKKKKKKQQMSHPSSCSDTHCSHTDSEHARADESLFALIDVANVRALNGDSAAVRSVVLPHAERRQNALVARAELADAGLIVHVPFTACVKLKSITCASPTSASSPRRVRCFANRTDIDFDNVDDAPCTQEFDLVADTAAQPDVEYAVKAAKWQRVESITLAFDPLPDAQDDDDDEFAVALTYLAFRGEFDQRIARQAVLAVYESTPQLQDHKLPSITGAREGL
jgi:hypothetical protein